MTDLRHVKQEIYLTYEEAEHIDKLMKFSGGKDRAEVIEGLIAEIVQDDKAAGDA